MENILEISDLSVHYHDGVTALRGLSLTIRQGERVAIIGPNGAGKTSLMLAIMGGVHWHGSIRVAGVELGPKSPPVRSGCGMLFQDADDQLFSPSLLEDAAFGPLNQGDPPDAARRKALAAIAAVGLEGLENRAAHHFSGGQKRCAALATVLSMEVKLLLLDEPGSNLDFRSRQRLIGLLSQRAEAQLLATHDLDMVERLCTRAIVLDGGQLVADGPAGEIVRNRDLLRLHGLAE